MLSANSSIYSDSNSGVEAEAGWCPHEVVSIALTTISTQSDQGAKHRCMLINICLTPSHMCGYTISLMLMNILYSNCFARPRMCVRALFLGSQQHGRDPEGC
jgi:hypothetical protein